MANPWFRMYAEFATDPKVQLLSEVDQRRFVMLLCVRCCNDDVTLHVTMTDENIAFQLRISADEWAKTKANLLSKNLITKNNLPTAWDKRQYKSDTSNDRVKAYRKRKKEEKKKNGNGDVTLHETLPKHDVTVTVTAPDTDTDTDIKKNISNEISKKNPPPPEKPKPKKYSERHALIAKAMAEQVQARYPDQKINHHEWADAVRKILELDKKPEAELARLWGWIQHHQNGKFSWADQIRSPMKLRSLDNQGLKYYDRLNAEMLREERIHASGNNQPRPNESLVERVRRGCEDRIEQRTGVRPDLSL